MKVFLLINDETGVVENATHLEEGAKWAPPEGYSIVEHTGENWIDDHYDKKTQKWTKKKEPEAPLPPEPGSGLNVIG